MTRRGRPRPSGRVQAAGAARMGTADVDGSLDDATRRVVDLLAPLGPVVCRPLFGTRGLYLEDRVFGLVADGRTYFRTSDATLAKYVRADAEPLRLSVDGQEPVEMQYHAVPTHVLADRDLACAWAYEALGST